MRVLSDAVRDALDVPEEAEAKKEALTDLQEVMALLAGLSPAAKMLLDTLHDHGWECVLNPDTTDSINEINKLASQYLACALLVQEHENLIDEDDYRDELDYIYSNRPETAEPKEPVSAEEDRNFERSVLSDPLKLLLVMLTPVQIESLCFRSNLHLLFLTIYTQEYMLCILSCGTETNSNFVSCLWLDWIHIVAASICK